MKNHDKDKAIKTNWTWGHEQGKNYEKIYGATIKYNRIVWWSGGYPGYTNGLSSSQRFDDFLNNGPYIPDVPEEIVIEMTSAIKRIKKKQIVKRIKISAMHLLFNAFYGLTLEEWCDKVKRKFPEENTAAIQYIIKELIEKKAKVQRLKDPEKGTIYVHLDLLL